MVELTKESMIRTLAAEEEPLPIDWRLEFEEVVAGLLMAALLVTLMLQIISRYVFNSPFIWTEEASRYLFMAMVFIGAAGGVAKRSHIAIEMFLTLLPQRLQRVFGIVSDLLVLLFLTLLFYWGLAALPRMWTLLSPAMQMPLGYVYVLIPLSAALMGARLIQHWIPRRTKNPSVKAS